MGTVLYGEVGVGGGLLLPTLTSWSAFLAHAPPFPTARLAVPPRAPVPTEGHGQGPESSALPRTARRGAEF